MAPSFTYNRQVLELVMNNEHFRLVYPRTPAGRRAAIAATRKWLINCELDFNRRDAESLWKAIDASRIPISSAGPRERCLLWVGRRP